MNLRLAVSLFLLIGASAFAAPTITIREGADNRPLPAMVIADCDGFTTAMLNLNIVFRAFDGATTTPLTMTKLNQAMKWNMPLSGAQVHIVVNIGGQRQPQTWDATVPDILTLFYPDADIPQLAADGRDLTQERIFCAKRYNRAAKADMVRLQLILDRLKESALIAVP